MTPTAAVPHWSKLAGTAWLLALRTATVEACPVQRTTCKQSVHRLHGTAQYPVQLQFQSRYTYVKVRWFICLPVAIRRECTHVTIRPDYVTDNHLRTFLWVTLPGNVVQCHGIRKWIGLTRWTSMPTRVLRSGLRTSLSASFSWTLLTERYLESQVSQNAS